MTRKLTFVLALVAACSMGMSAAMAGGPGCGQHGADKTAKAEGCAKACKEMTEFPTLTMMVGEEKFSSPEAAEQAATATNGKIVYVVREEKFDGKDKAMPALACAAECYVRQYTTIGCVIDGKVKYCATDDCCGKSGCDKSGKLTAAGDKAGCGHGDKAKAMKADEKGKAGYAHGEKAGLAKAGEKEKAGCGYGGKPGETMKMADGTMCDKSKCKEFVVAGQKFTSWDEAVKAHQAVVEATKKVQMTCWVNGEKVESMDQVCPTAKAAGKVHFTVNEQKTECEYDARVLTAKAQYEAAQQALDTVKTAKM